MSQSPLRVGRPLVAGPSSRSGRAERGDRDAVERGAGQLLPDQRVGVVVGQPARPCAAPRRPRASQSARPWPCPRGTRGERALLGLQLGGLVQPALDGRVGHVRTLGAWTAGVTIDCEFLPWPREALSRGRRGGNVCPWRRRAGAATADMISRPSSPTRSATSCWSAPARPARPRCWRRCWSARGRIDPRRDGGGRHHGLGLRARRAGPWPLDGARGRPARPSGDQGQPDRHPRVRRLRR